jgi:hypothetical protein
VNVIVSSAPPNNATQRTSGTIPEERCSRVLTGTNHQVVKAAGQTQRIDGDLHVDT